MPDKDNTAHKAKLEDFIIVALPWLSWLAAVSLYFYAFGLLNLPAALTSMLHQRFAMTAVEVGIISSAFLYTYVIMQVPAGLVVDKYGARKVCIAAALLMTVGSILFAIAQQFYLHVGARLLMGLGGGVTFVATLYLVRSWFTAALFPILVAISSSMSGVGTVAIPALYAYLIKVRPANTVLIEIALVGLLLFIFVVLFVRDKIADKNSHHQPSINMLTDLKVIITNGKVWLLVIYASFSFAHYAVWTDMWRIPFELKVLHMNYSSAIYYNGIDVTGFIVGCIILGYLATRFEMGRLALLFCITELCLFILSNVNTYFLLSHPDSELLKISWGIILFALGLTTGGVISSFALVQRVIPSNTYGCASGFINMFFGGIGIVLVPIFGLVASHYDIITITPVTLMLVVLSIVSIVCLSVFLKLSSTHSVS